MSTQTCAIVVPLYTLQLSPEEKASLSTTLRRLRRYTFVVLHKASVPPARVQRVISSTGIHNLSVVFQSISDSDLESVSSYNFMLLQPWFYRLFLSWDYILIVQLDAWIFKTNLDLWLQKKYTYIGAPWISTLGSDTPEHGVGNGGLSLRHVQSFLKIVSSRKFYRAPVFTGFELLHRIGVFWKYRHIPLCLRPQYFLKRVIVFFRMSFGWHNTLAYYSSLQTPEDRIFGIYSPHVFHWMRIPSLEQAAAFAIETNPLETFRFNGNKTPFGCHAWEKYNKEFWLTTFSVEFSKAHEKEAQNN